MYLSLIFVLLTTLHFVIAAPAATQRTNAVTATTTTPQTSPLATINATRRTKTRTRTRTSVTTSSTTSPTPVKRSGKRGLAYNDPSLTSYFSLSGQKSKVSWAYNWASDPYFGGWDQGGWTPGTFHPYLDFVPMLWSAAPDLTSIWNANVANAISTYKSSYALAFNEPDLCCATCGSSCIAITDAVAAYKKWVQPFAGKVKLGAPAVTNGVGENIGLSYLKNFIGNCTGCTIDFIPIHWYGDVNNPASFQSYVQSAYQQFNKPIWITEFGVGGTDAQIDSFLETVLPWLDQQTYVQRYAYFMDQATGSPYLLETNRSMTSIGEVYNSF